jgi:hypothetical protein
MASYQKRTYGDGSKSVFAWVRIKPFKPASRSYSNQAEAKRWATGVAQAEEARRRAAGSDQPNSRRIDRGILATWSYFRPQSRQIDFSNFPIFIGGEGEIRTRDRIAPMPVFKTGAFNRSATSPLI